MTKVKLDTGQVLNFDGDPSQEQIENAVSQVTGQQTTDPQRSDIATKEQQLGIGERLSTGFEFDPNKAVAQKVAERGLEPGTPLEPTPGTASFLENVKDIPADIADMVGPAFPIFGEIFGSLAGAASAAGSTVATAGAAAPTIPAQVVVGSVAGAAGGELLRQEIGRQLGFEQGSIGEKAGKVAFEGGLALAGNAVAKGLGIAIKSTKKGILKASEKLLDKKGIDGFTKVAGRVFRNMDSVKTQKAIDMIRSGDNSVLNKEIADPAFSNKFFKQLFFGEASGKKGNLASQIRKLGIKKESRVPMKEMYNKFLGLSDEAFEQSVKKGNSINKFNNPKGVLNLGNKILKETDELVNKVGKQLGVARSNLAKNAPGVEVGDFLTQANEALAQQLKNTGFLIDEGAGVYSINSSFAATSTGKQQAGHFSQLINRFFSKAKGFSEIQENALRKAIVSGDQEAIERITRGKTFNSRSTMKAKEFLDKLKTIDVQISGNEFKALGKMSPASAEYFKNVRGIVNQVADVVGDNNVKGLNNAYREIIESTAPLRSGKRLKDITGIEQTLNKLSNPKLAATAEEAVALDSFLKKNLNINLLDDLSAFKSAKEIKALESGFGSTQKRQSFMNLMKNAFSDSNFAVLDDAQKFVDPHLPSSLKIALNAQRHTIAEALEKDATSILKARFISGGLGLGGFAIGGPAGAATGLATGFAAQNPKVLKALIKFAAKSGGKSLGTGAATTVPRQPLVTGTQLIGQLINNKSPK